MHQVEMLKDQWGRFSAHLSMRRNVELSCKVLITPALWGLSSKFGEAYFLPFAALNWSHHIRHDL